MNRTGTDLEISSSRLYHLEMASSASSEAPRRPLDTPKRVCGPNLAQGWHRIRSQQNAPIAATPAAPSPPAHLSLRPVAAPSYLPGRLPRAARRRATSSPRSCRTGGARAGRRPARTSAGSSAGTARRRRGPWGRRSTGRSRTSASCSCRRGRRRTRSCCRRAWSKPRSRPAACGPGPALCFG